ncbi:MAG: stage V sporulation protein S [Bacilli bacterium]|nr:stage V sporulation protein S [Bacilli bacterium]
MEMIKVATNSSPSKVAGSLATIIREQKVVEIQTIGAGALNQAIKAIAIARGFLVSSGIDIVVIPSFREVMINQSEKTAIKLRIERR